MVEDEGGISPVGGLTRNLCGDEVWTLNAIGVVAERDLRRTLARHLELSIKSRRTSESDTTMSGLSINGDREVRNGEMACML